MPLSALVVRRQLGKVYGGPHHGTRYAMERACARCGTGAEQVGPLRLGSLRLPGPPISTTLDDEVLVAGPLAATLRAQGVTCLGDVVHARSGEPLGMFQLRPEATLPPFGADTRGVVRDRPCPVCLRDGHYAYPDEPYDFSYPALADEILSRDVLATYERFGKSVLREPFKDSVFAAPVLVVGARLASLLKAASPREVVLHPVRLGDRR